MKYSSKNIIFVIIGLFIFKIAVADTFRPADTQDVSFNDSSVVVRK